MTGQGKKKQWEGWWGHQIGGYSFSFSPTHAEVEVFKGAGKSARRVAAVPFEPGNTSDPRHELARFALKWINTEGTARRAG